MTTLAASIAGFVASLEMNTMPRPVLAKAKASLLNAYGMALAGHDTPYAPLARAAAIALDERRIAA